ncbi:MAG: helix-turn-helix domain-containing protein [Verrucomicrobia bacterium]|jgi:transcriptional regulator with XRE-family HTH domain|nr:helix-turn-helix domain-containing protein [Verrucomicrobiota bacterium]
MARQNLTGARLAEEIGISATSVSQILTGKTRPRQVTLSRMMKVLCQSSREEQVLLAAYESLGETKLPASPLLDDPANAATEEERVRRFLEMKTAAVAFRNKVAATLDKTAIPFQSDFTKGPVITDFMIEVGDERIALECRANVKRDLERSLISARIIRDELKCDQVLIIVPKMDDALTEACSSQDAIQTITPKNLPQGLRTLSNRKRR